MWSSVQNPVIQKNIAPLLPTDTLHSPLEIVRDISNHCFCTLKSLTWCRRTVQSVKRITWKTCWKPGKKINTDYCDCHTVLLMLKGDLCARLRRSRYWLWVKSPSVSLSAFTETDVGVSSYFHLKSQSNLNGPRDFIHHTLFFSIFVPLKRGIKKLNTVCKDCVKIIRPCWSFACDRSGIQSPRPQVQRVPSIFFFLSPPFLSLFPPPSLSLIIHRLARRPHSPRMLTDSSSSRAVAGY